MIHHNRKLVFIHIPKCGGSSVRRSIWVEGLAINPSPHSRAEKIIEKKAQVNIRTKKLQWYEEQQRHFRYDEVIDLFPNYKYITQVRNPVERWKSFWKMRKQNQWHKIPDINTWTEQILLNFRYGALPEHADTCWLLEPAWKWIGEKVEVHKLEEHTIWGALGVEELNNWNVSVLENPELDSVLEEKVKSLYYKDYELFGYER